MLQECLDNEQRIIIDIKEPRLDVVQIVLDAYKKYPKLFQRGVVSSFNPIVVYMVCKMSINGLNYNIYIDYKYLLNFTFRLERKTHVSSRVSLGGHIFSRDRRMPVWKHPARPGIIIRSNIWQLAFWRFYTSGYYRALSTMSSVFPLCCCTRI